MLAIEAQERSEVNGSLFVHFPKIPFIENYLISMQYKGNLYSQIQHISRKYRETRVLSKLKFGCSRFKVPLEDIKKYSEFRELQIVLD